MKVNASEVTSNRNSYRSKTANNRYRQKNDKVKNPQHRDKYLNIKQTSIRAEKVNQYNRTHSGDMHYDKVYNSNKNMVYLNIAKQAQAQNLQDLKASQDEYRKTRPFSRQNMQLMNKKYRELRNSRYSSSSLGIYDLQNDARFTRPVSCLADYFQNSGFKPEIRSMQTSKETKRKKLSEGVKRTSSANFKSKAYQKQTNNRFSSNIDPLASTSDVFMPSKQSNSGMVLHQFQSSLKKKCVQDNLYVMASVLKRKLKVLDKKEVMQYVNKLMSRHDEHH